MRPPLHQAIFDGNETRTLELLTGNVEINQLAPNGWTPLMVAAFYHRPATVKLLLEKGADKTLYEPKNGFTSLHKAAERGWNDIIEILLDDGDDINVKTTINGSTPLSIAAKFGHPSTVQLLIDREASLKIKTKLGETPVFKAAENGNVEIIKILQKAGASLDEINNEDATPLYVAIQKNQPKVVEYLISQKCRVNLAKPTGWTCLHAAVYYAGEDIIQLLLKNGASPRAEILQNGYIPLHTAAKAGNIAGINLLLAEPDANINAKSSVRWRTALSAAVLVVGNDEKKEAKAIQTVTWLLRKKADPNIADCEGKIPLDIAKQNKNKELEKLLIDWERVANMEIESSSEKSVSGELLSLLVSDAGSDKWFGEFQKFSAILGIRKSERKESDRVRIAILDSGMDENHPLREYVQDGIKDQYKDFVDKETEKGPSKPKDLHGDQHGSAGLDLIFRIAPEAEVFVARVFEKAQANNNTPKLIAEAS
ncbi:hypothetical protein TWF694_011747 [Orbilia ellipsospora]|uniref:Ankyrin repeat protein n=1 Tax=Orbilia ellipsospora TaxID=2528407 RepID=A0AAV9X661_9PEZI